MKKYRIKEVIYSDGRKEYFSLYYGKYLEQKHTTSGVVFNEIDGWLSLNKSGEPFGTYTQALELINDDRKSLHVLEEKFYDVD